MASHLQRISSSVKFLVFRPHFHGAGQIFEWTKTCIERSFVYTGPKQNRASFFNWQAKGNLGKRPRTREKGGSFPPPPPPPPFLPPSRPSCFCRSQNPLHFPFERLPCKVICNRIYTFPCERAAQVKNSSAEKSEKFDRTFVKGV